MLTNDDSEAGAAGRVLRVHTSAQHRRSVGFVALSASTSLDETEGGRETVYRMHTMDMTTRRMIPHLLGVSDRGCEHIACEMVMLNSLAAGYMVEMGWSNDHSQQYAVDLLRANGGDISFS